MVSVRAKSSWRRDRLEQGVTYEKMGLYQKGSPRSMKDNFVAGRKKDA